MESLVNKFEAITSNLSLSSYLPHINKHFTRPNPLVFWLDFLCSCFIGNMSIYGAVFFENLSWQQFLCIFIASVALFRSSIFIHEAYHLRKHLKGFIWGYNICHGFLHKLPYYIYTPHYFHHNDHTFGTLEDPEYDTLAKHPVFALVFPLFGMVILTVFLFVRFTIVPFLLPFIGSRGRLFVYRYASTLALNPRYKRPGPTRQEQAEWFKQDFGCALYSVLFGIGMVTGVLPWKLLIVWFAVIYGLYLLNYYRVLASHRYISGHNQLTKKQQILDSITIQHSFVNAWLFPVGLRYHALHHMFPQIPYHNMGKAHKWLLTVLPEDHPYRQTISTGYFTAIKDFLLSVNNH